MNKKINSRPASQETTKDFPTALVRKILSRYDFIAVVCLGVFSFVLSGFIIYGFTVKNKEVIKPSPSPIIEVKPKQDTTSIDVGLALDRLARKKAVDFLRESWLGVLEIKDGKAITVRYKRAALGNKNGFIDLKNNVPYTIHNYFVYADKGYGIADDGEQNFFLAVWHPGTTKVPLINPGTIIILSGDRVETGKP